MAPRPTRRRRAGLRVEHRRVAHRPAHLMGRLPARPGPARPGGLDAAAETYQKTLDIAAASGPPAAPPAGPAYVGLAEVAYQRNELDSALRLVTEGITLCRQFLYPAPLGTGLVTLAWIRQAHGDPDGALEAMGEAGGPPWAQALPACSTPSPRRGRGCCWPRATSPRPPAGQKNAASARATNRATLANRSIWYWPGCCSPKTTRLRRLRSWKQCSPQPLPNAGPAALSRSARCGRWRWRPAATRTPR